MKKKSTLKKRFEKGTMPSSKTLNWIADQLERFNNMTGVNLNISSTTEGMSISSDDEFKIYAKITSGSNPYAWSEVTPDTGGTFVVTSGGRSGTTSDNAAYEINGKSVPANKIVVLRPGVQNEWLFEYIVGGCTGTVNAGPINCNGTLTGVTFELRNAADTVTLDTKTGTSVSFTGLSGGTGYKVRASKTGYHTKTSATVTPACGGLATATISTWPTTMVLTGIITFRDFFPGECPMASATVSVSGDAAGSATTDSSGAYSLTATTSSSSINQTFTLVATPPGGVGATARTITGNIRDACSPIPLDTYCLPDADHAPVVCNGYYMPEIMHHEDDFGEADATWNGSYWYGEYVYTSSNCIKEIDCSGTLTEVADQTGDVLVGVELWPYRSGFGDTFSCSSRKFRFFRLPNHDEARIACATPLLRKCQPRDGGGGAFIGFDESYYVIVSTSCSSSISMSATLPGYTFIPGCPVEETAVDITWTGSV